MRKLRATKKGIGMYSMGGGKTKLRVKKLMNVYTRTTARAR